MKKRYGTYGIITLSFVLSIVYAIVRIVLVDRFHVNGRSMEPTLYTGDIIYVEKWTLGARIYTSYSFNTAELSSFRMPGIGKLKSGDIIVFNSPEGGNPGEIGFRLNYVCAKRIIGIPGDTISVVNGLFYNNNSHLSPRANSEMMLQNKSVKNDSVRSSQEKVLGSKVWTIKDYGPVVVPSKGCTMCFDSATISVYGMAVEYESGRFPLAGETYTFKGDWYFVGGDNVLGSRDSRHFGVIPVDYIIGRVMSMGHTDRVTTEWQ